MKLLFLAIIACFLSFNCYSQSTLNNKLNVIASNLAQKLKEKAKDRVVILYVTDINKNMTACGKYIADAVSLNLVNIPGFEVFDRDNLDAITDAKKLIAEGYINAEKAKQLGQMLSVNCIVIGNYAVLNNSIKLILKALDANTGFVIAANTDDLPLDADIATLLGISSYGSPNRNPPNRGFNTPINTNEQYNNPQTVDSECARQHLGDYCFYNNTHRVLTVTLQYNYMPAGWVFPNFSETSTTLTIKPGESKCITGIIAVRGRITNHFEAKYYDEAVKGFGMDVVVDQGDLQVEQCKSKTYYIK